MKKIIVAGAVLLLAGCSSLSNLTINDFEMRDAAPEQVTRDGAYCKAQASAAIDSDPRGMGESFYRRHRVYNRIYAACMRDHGYAPRAFWENALADF